MAKKQLHLLHDQYCQLSNLVQVLPSADFPHVKPAGAQQAADGVTPLDFCPGEAQKNRPRGLCTLTVFQLEETTGMDGIPFVKVSLEDAKAALAESAPSTVSRPQEDWCKFRLNEGQGHEKLTWEAFLWLASLPRSVRPNM